MKKKISALISFYNDFDFFDDVFRTLADWVDEIVILDGPFEWAVDLLKYLGEYYDEKSLPRELRAYAGHPKVTYVYRLWRDEREKRIFGYEACRHDLVLLVDADEIIRFDAGAIDNFKSGSKAVAAFDCINLIRPGVVMSRRAGDSAAGRDLPRKNCLFKRSAIGAEAHLDYLWLVNVEQKPADPDLIETASAIGTGYHLTLMRGLKGQIVKYAFYASLHSRVHGAPSVYLRSFGCDDYRQLSRLVKPELFRKVFARSMFWSLGAATDWILEPKRRAEPALDAVASRYGGNHIHGFIAEGEDVPLMNDVPSIRYLEVPDDSRAYECVLSLSNVRGARIQYHPVFFGEDCREPASTHDCEVVSGPLRLIIPAKDQGKTVFAHLLVLLPKVPYRSLGVLESITLRPLE